MTVTGGISIGFCAGPLTFGATGTDRLRVWRSASKLRRPQEQPNHVWLDDDAGTALGAFCRSYVSVRRAAVSTGDEFRPTT